MGNSIGQLFRVTTFGESHGKAIGAVIDGCPAGLRLAADDIQLQLDRRKPGQSDITTSRSEADQVQIMSGVFDDVTLGTSIGLLIFNKDAKSSAYDHLKDLYRPGHADYTYEARYGLRDWRGGGRASARETAARVAAGAVAKALVSEIAGIETLAWVERVKDIEGSIDGNTVTSEMIESNIVRCPDGVAAEKMIDAIRNAKERGDSLGGKVSFRVTGCPAGFGDPVFDKLTADIAKACMSISATKGISFGAGERATYMTGAEHNDPFQMTDNDRVGTRGNNAGGMLGGISNGEPITGSIFFKPTATIRHKQDTVTRDGKAVSLEASGRHDPCVLPRAVPIVEAMINLVMADHLMRHAVANVGNLKKIMC